MSQPNTRAVCLLGPTTVTTSGNGGDINLLQGWDAAVLSVTLSTTSGTSPTFDVYIQKRIPQCGTGDTTGGLPSGTAVYDDILHFTQLSTNGTRLAHISENYSPALTANATSMTTADWAQSDASLGAATLRVGPIGGTWRVKYVVGGTSPSTVLCVVAELTNLGG
jgi:hypothetical protein